FTKDDSVSLVDVANQALTALKLPSFEKIRHEGTWGEHPLTKDQIIYAAEDVFILFHIMDYFKSKFTLENPKIMIEKKEEKRYFNTLCQDVLTFLKNEKNNNPRPQKLHNYLKSTCTPVQKYFHTHKIMENSKKDYI